MEDRNMSTLNQFIPGRMQNYPYIFTATNAAWAVPYTGKYRISVMGAGASGGAIFYTTVGGAASGGGGGGFTEIEVDLIAADSLNIVVGAGGAVATSTVSQTGIDGNDGVDCSVHGSGGAVATALNLHAGPGLHGHWTITNAATAAGGDHGIGSGGTINAEGGLGGDAKMYTGSTNTAAGGGGGAGGPLGPGAAGGSAIGAAAIALACGGGGAANGGYAGRSVTTAVLGGGGGMGAIAASATGGFGKLNIGAFCADGAAHSAGWEVLYDVFRAYTGYGASGSSTLATAILAGTGGGGGGQGVTSTTASVLKSMGGGSGGATLGGAVLGVGIAYGGGSGGVVSSTTGPATSGKGGSGIVVIERIG
jgi:hypothetical protein